MTETDWLKQLESEAESPQPAPGFGARALIVLGIIVVFVAVVGIALARQNQGAPTDGAAPDFTITTFDGTAYTLSQQRGKVVVVNFWASWCDPCKDEAPALQRLSQKYGDQVLFLGITHVDEPANSLAFMRQYGITYPNGEDPRDDISKKLYRITGVPETFVIDQDGNIAKWFYSVVPEAEMTTLLDTLLGTSAWVQGGLIIGFALALIVVAFIVAPLLRRSPPNATGDPLSDRQREQLLLYYERVVRNLRDLDEDNALGKIESGLYEQDRAQWVERGVQALKALETLDQRELLTEQATPDNAAMDHAIDDAIEAAVQAAMWRAKQSAG